MNIREKYNEKIHEKVLYSRSNNGLNIFYIPKEGYVKKHAILATNYGSIDNKFIPIGEEDILEVPEGIAHFLEHKLFEEPKANIFDKFSKMGAYVNAYTNYNQTAYLFYCTDHFYENLELLVRFVQNPYLTEENVEKEKGIIGQEIKMYADDPAWRVHSNLLNSMYYKHPVKIDIGGTLESINTITKDLLYKAYNTFYHPSNMVLFVTGDLDFKKVINTVNQVEKNYDPYPGEIKRIFDEEPEEIRERFIEERMPTSAPLFTIGFKDVDLGYTGEENIRKDIVTNIILDVLMGSSSHFYNELYKSGLIDADFGSYYTGKSSYGYTLIYGESDEPKTVYGKVQKLVNQPVEKVLKEEDFNRIKNKYLGAFLLRLNSMDFISGNFIELYFDDFLIIDYLDLMDSISYKEVVERFKHHFVEERSALSIIQPSKV
ncbi:MAG TPA: pitrilysin family protein [Tissierellaceae bacterium]|nr:pitrilysin family protein [Tissierellaceae bacterium]